MLKVLIKVKAMYGLQVHMNASSIALRVFAALVSCLLSDRWRLWKRLLLVITFFREDPRKECISSVIAGDVELFLNMTSGFLEYDSDCRIWGKDSLSLWDSGCEISVNNFSVSGSACVVSCLALLLLLLGEPFISTCDLFEDSRFTVRGVGMRSLKEVVILSSTSLDLLKVSLFGFVADRNNGLFMLLFLLRKLWFDKSRFLFKRWNGQFAFSSVVSTFAVTFVSLSSVLS